MIETGHAPEYLRAALKSALRSKTDFGACHRIRLRGAERMTANRSACRQVSSSIGVSAPIPTIDDSPQAAAVR